MNKGIGNFTAGLMNIPPDGFTGNTEHCCRLFLFKVLQIDQFQYRYLFGKECDNLILFVRAALRRVTPRG